MLANYPKVQKWLDDEKEKLVTVWTAYGHTGEVLELHIKRESKNLDDYVLRVYNLITKKEKEEVKFFYKYFKNLSNNTMTAFLFREFTGVKTGTTNKSGIKAFNSYFGLEVENEIKEKKQKEKEEAAALIRKEKEEKENELKQYFSNSIWDISKATNMQIGRIRKSLDERYNFINLGKILSLKEYIENYIKHIGKYKTNNMYKMNYDKYNVLYGYEKKEYRENLLIGRTHYVSLEGDRRFEIPKIVFDILTLEDLTDYEALEKAS